MFRSFLRSLSAAGLIFASASNAAVAQNARLPDITGVVDDATTGLGVAGALVIDLRSDGFELGRATTDSHGRFTLADGFAPNVRLRVERAGYVTTDSDALNSSAAVTVALQAAPSATSDARTIATTSSRATTSLQKSSTIYRTLSPTQLIESGVNRYGDALRMLPGINNAINGDTASLGDDLQLSIRGLGNGNTRTGQIETTPTLDGHPIGYGAPGGFNYQLSPTFGLKGITVYYGSAGTGITGYDAIGGIIDAQTIDPTPDRRISVTQGGGTFDKYATNVTATGSFDRLGYAASLGVATLDGPFHDDYRYQPGAAYDPSATDPAVRALGVYKDDGTALSRDGVFKLRYSLSDATDVTLTNVDSSYYEDKTGNGDGDYLTPHIALLTGRGLLAGKAGSDPCPAGQFTATNANGTPWGMGPSGLPDGGSACQTPQSYAKYAAGYQGAGTAWQTFDFNDEALHLRSTGTHEAFTLDAFTNRYLDTQDRKFQLPFNVVPGDAGSYSNNESSSAGAVAREDFLGRNNDLGVGVGYTNYFYRLQTDSKLVGAPIAHEDDAFVREAYRAAGSPLAIYASADFKNATETHTSYVDPRASLVYTAGRSDVLRVAAGATTAQPAGNLLSTGFNPSALVTAGGGGGINCASTNSIGSAPSSLLKPERGVDEEFAYGHNFGGDSQVEFEIYNTDVYDKIYTTTTPLSITGTGFIDPVALASVEATAEAKCGSANPLTLLGVSGFVNIGQLRAQGFTLSGRQRLSTSAFVDYDYGTTSTVVRSATPQFYKQNLTIIQDAQLPRVPLQTFNIALDGAIAPQIDVRYTLHYVGDNNTKRIGAYTYADLRVSASHVGPGTLSASVFNLFDQDAFIEGLLDEGEPLALNRYATKAQYAPYTGAGETEKFGLPFRQLYFTYTLLTGAGTHR